MTVAELIEVLREHDQNGKVMVRDAAGNHVEAIEDDVWGDGIIEATPSGTRTVQPVVHVSSLKNLPSLKHYPQHTWK